MTSAAAADDEAPEFASPDTWHTGTALDEFTPIYLALARSTKTHGPISPADVDRLDLAVVAALLGAHVDAYDTMAATDVAELRRRAMAGETVSWEDVS